MNRLSKISFLVSGISFICLILSRMVFGGWHHLMWIPLVFFLVFLVYPLVKEIRFFVSFFTMKTTKKGLSMGALIVLMLTVLTLVNLISVRKYKTWDFSAAKTNTLSDQSIKLLKGLDEELKVIFFYKNGQEGVEENRRAFRELIKKYQDQTDRIRLDFIEVNERPDIAKEYGVDKGSGIVFLNYKGRKNRIEKIEEQEVTGALVKVTREKDKIVYFVTGHGESDLEDNREATGLNALRMMISNNRYEVKTLALNVAPKVPADADMVAVVGPQQNFLEHEIQALEDYLKRGGSLLLALESQKTGGLEKILAKLGIEPRNDYVLNLIETVMGKGVNQGPTVAPNFSLQSEITKVFGRNEAVVFRFPMGLKVGKAPAGVELDEIVKTPEESMAFSDLRISGDGQMGPATLGVTAKGRFPGADEKAPEFRLVVYGDADFLSNALLYQNLNRDLALNTLASLSKEENLISITPKDQQVTQMSYVGARRSFFLWGFVIPLPLLLLAAAVGLWTRRRFA